MTTTLSWLDHAKFQQNKLDLFYREKAELAQDEEEKSNWEKEADKLALKAVEVARQKKIDEERARKQVFSAEEEAEKE